MDLIIFSRCTSGSKEPPSSTLSFSDKGFQPQVYFQTLPEVEDLEDSNFDKQLLLELFGHEAYNNESWESPRCDVSSKCNSPGVCSPNRPVLLGLGSSVLNRRKNSLQKLVESSFDSGHLNGSIEEMQFATSCRKIAFTANEKPCQKIVEPTKPIRSLQQIEHNAPTPVNSEGLFTVQQPIVVLDNLPVQEPEPKTPAATVAWSPPRKSMPRDLSQFGLTRLKAELEQLIVQQTTTKTPLSLGSVSIPKNKVETPRLTDTTQVQVPQTQTKGVSDLKVPQLAWNQATHKKCPSDASVAQRSFKPATVVLAHKPLTKSFCLSLSDLKTPTKGSKIRKISLDSLPVSNLRPKSSEKRLHIVRQSLHAPSALREMRASQTCLEANMEYQLSTQNIGSESFLVKPNSNLANFGNNSQRQLGFDSLQKKIEQVLAKSSKKAEFFGDKVQEKPKATLLKKKLAPKLSFATSVFKCDGFKDSLIQLEKAKRGSGPPMVVGNSSSLSRFLKQTLSTYTAFSLKHGAVC